MTSAVKELIMVYELGKIFDKNAAAAAILFSLGDLAYKGELSADEVKEAAIYCYENQ